MPIRDFLEMLTDGQRERLARVRKVEPDRLPSSYRGDWVRLVRDLTPAEMHRALRNLSDDELRVITLRAFDGRQTELDKIKWTEDGRAPKRRQAVGIVRAICNWTPEALRQETWESTIVPMLRDAGIKPDRTPEKGTELIELRRIFP